jgi:uncharacterized protein
VTRPGRRAGPRRLTRSDARRALWRYHFAPGEVASVAERLGSIQYDPLAPMGRNPDLVLQARVPGYRVGDWHASTYDQRLLLDAWDKMVCLTLTQDWPARHLYHTHFERQWRRDVFDAHPDAVEATLAELRASGPMQTRDFSDQTAHPHLRGSWYGPKLVKHVLRALWDSGRVVTHGRDQGRHVYDLPERSLPRSVVDAPPLPADEAVRRLVRRRVQAPGLLRPRADATVWYLPVERARRVAAAEALIAGGELLPVEVDGTTFWAVPEALAALDAARGPERGARFLAPLDSLLWDRSGVQHLYGFDYVWEVYKPAAKRRWGYYVLPVLWGERFVARFDARVEDSRLVIHAWHWEPELRAGTPPGLAGDLEAAAAGFLAYLGIDAVRLPSGLGRDARAAWQRAARRASAARPGTAGPAGGAP